MTEEPKRKIISEPKKNHHKRVKKTLSSSFWFIIIALTAAGGYLVGTYHNQIKGMIAPIFGYNAYSGDLDLSALQEVYATLAANYDGTLDKTALVEGASKGLVEAAGDDYTVYMTAAEASEYADDLSGTIGGGIGAEIGIKNDVVTVMSVLADNPAIKAGIKANDVILKINDETTEGLTVSEAVLKIRGEEGTTVKITVLRGTEVKDFTITRAIVNNPSVTSSFENGLGTIKITRFDEDTSSLAKTAAQSLIKQGVKSIILDLRDNPGGYVSAAKGVAGLWLDDKTIVTEQTIKGVVTDTIKSGSDAILKGIPTVVLVNESSASASEIVAGALQDYDAAKLVGQTTFGKGCVQNLITLGNGGQLKVTIAKWYTPDGKNIMNNGIKPDVEAEYTQKDVDAGIDPQMNAAKAQLGY